MMHLHNQWKYTGPIRVVGQSDPLTFLVDGRICEVSGCGQMQAKPYQTERDWEDVTVMTEAEIREFLEGR